MPEERIAGKYTLLRKLAAGGMAEVFLARQEGIEGFEKLVVLKRTLPHLAANPRFVQMFLDEARTAADLRHPNVVDIYDVGEHEGTYYIAMEFLHGQNLRSLWRTANAQQAPIPWTITLQVVIDAARGLHHAHSKSNMAGTALHIVHRDVSPHNIIVTYDGVTKIVDFGIAKAERQAQGRTETGIVKGKVDYMSPEQAMGLDVDATSDQFSLGIVLYELLTGHRLFERSNGYASMRAIVECQIPPPASHLPGFDEELAGLTLRALARKPEHRFPDCEAMATSLEDLVAERGWRHSPDRVGRFMRTLFDEEIRNEVVQPTNWTMLPQPETDEVDPPAALPDADTAFMPSVPTPVSRSGQETIRRTNIAPMPTNFVGRRRDLDALASLIDGGARLVTILGPGGTGKTRLAQVFGESRVADINLVGGVWFCELENARTVENICAAMSMALSVPLEGAATVQEAVEHVGHALAGLDEALLILDNVEQVAGGTAETVGRWLEMAPKTRFLLTSRQVLGLAGESRYELQALTLPERGKDPHESEAVQLFIERVQNVRRSFAPSAADLDVIARIVTRLEGMPLSIELAAARLSVLTPKQLLERLDRRLEVLGSGTGSSRQATLRGAIDWSWELLTPWEKAALAQCAIFRGGFSLEAAEAVLDLSEFSDAPLKLDVVQSLQEKSLLRTFEPPGLRNELRFGMYESIQEYAAEKLTDETRRATVDRHARYYVNLASQWAADISRTFGRQAMAHLRVEARNVLAVFDAGIHADPQTPASAAMAAQAVLSLFDLFRYQGPLSAYVSCLNRVLEADVREHLPPDTLVELRARRGIIFYNTSDSKSAQRDLTQAIDAARERGMQKLEAETLATLGSVLYYQEGKIRESEAPWRRCLELARAVDDKVCESSALRGLGHLAWETDDVVTALAHFEEALEVARESQHLEARVICLNNLATLRHQIGPWSVAAACLEEAARTAHKAGMRRNESISRYRLAILRLERGERKEALAEIRQVRTVLRRLGSQRPVAVLTMFEADILMELGELDEAQKKYTAAEQALRALGDRRSSALAVARRGVIEALRGNQASALDLLDKAEAEQRELSDTFYVRETRLHRHQLALLEARQALAHGDETRSREIVAQIEDVIRDTNPAGDLELREPDPATPNDNLADVERFAIRLLKIGLESIRA